MSQIVLIHGRKRAGKDYIASMLKSEIEELGSSAEIISFADPMKQIIATTFNISLTDLDQFKNKSERYKVFALDNANSMNMKAMTNFREILQRFGTEAMKPQFGDSVWADLLKSKADKSKADFILVPDFRFPVEHIEGSITIKVNCDLCDESDTHISENALNDFKFNYQVNNDQHLFNVDNAKYLATILINKGK